MKKSHYYNLLSFLLTGMLVIACKTKDKEYSNKTVAADVWKVDFQDDFDTFNLDNWQDQRIWVNNETHCYVPDNEFGTREVSNGTLKLKVVNIGEKISCDNLDKHGNQHLDTEYVAGRIVSKNKKEFIKGKWTARLKLGSNGEPSMFPAWWLLGAQNNEPPVQTLRVNLFKRTVEQVLSLFTQEGYTVAKSNIIPECIYLINGQAAKSTAFEKGFVTIQDEDYQYICVEAQGNNLFNIVCCSNHSCYRRSRCFVCCVTTVKVSKLLVTFMSF